MKTIKAFIDKHPVPSYYALVFAISWGGILLVAGLGPGGVPADANAVRAPGIVRRPQRSGHPHNRPPLRKGGLSQPPRQDDEVAGWRPLVRRRAPYGTAAGDGDTPCVL